MLPTFETGYTPNNLETALEYLGWTQVKLADFLGKAPRTVRQWLHRDLTSRNHADMPHALWLLVIEEMKNHPTNDK